MSSSVADINGIFGKREAHLGEMVVVFGLEYEEVVKSLDERYSEVELTPRPLSCFPPSSEEGSDMFLRNLNQVSRFTPVLLLSVWLQRRRI